MSEKEPAEIEQKTEGDAFRKALEECIIGATSLVNQLYRVEAELAGEAQKWKDAHDRLRAEKIELRRQLDALRAERDKLRRGLTEISYMGQVEGQSAGCPELARRVLGSKSR